MAEKLKVCSFNLRIDNENDGINRYTNRSWRVFETIEREAPDLIGFQEATDMMREDLKEKLTDYVIYGCGRNSDYLGESPVLAIRKGKFEVVSSENFWLSYTPNIPGSTFGNDQSKCPRVTTSVLLKPHGSENLLRFVNTHLDHKGETAKLLGATELVQYLSDKPERFVLTGDFNSLPESAAIAAITFSDHFGKPVTEITRGIKETFHNYGKLSGCKIDYIFTDAESKETDAYAINEPPINGVYISDHHPIIAYIEI